MARTCQNWKDGNSPPLSAHVVHPASWACSRLGMTQEAKSVHPIKSPFVCLNTVFVWKAIPNHSGRPGHSFGKNQIRIDLAWKAVCRKQAQGPYTTIYTSRKHCDMAEKLLCDECHLLGCSLHKRQQNEELNLNSTANIIMGIVVIGQPNTGALSAMQ